jgi:hypothetical protein
MESPSSDSLMDAITEVFNKSASVSKEDSVKIMEVLEANCLGMMCLLQSWLLAETGKHL